MDATDKILGRMASTIANHIRGKNLATYTPSVDMGAYVVVVHFSSLTVIPILFTYTQKKSRYQVLTIFTIQSSSVSYKLAVVIGYATFKHCLCLQNP